MKWWDRTDPSMSLAYSENYRLFLFHCSVVFECSKRSTKRRAGTQVCIWERNSSSQRWYSQDYKQYNSFHNTEKSEQMEIRVRRFTESKPFIKVYIRRIQLHFQEPRCRSFLLLLCGHKKQHLHILAIFIINVQEIIYFKSKNFWILLPKKVLCLPIVIYCQVKL